MTERPRMTLTGAVLDGPSAGELAAFYRRLLDWTVAAEESDWVKLVPPGGGAGLAFQSEPGYIRPVWPSEPGRQQMIIHLDIEVDDLDPAVAYATELGATLHGFQPQDDVRVCLDPAGHPFCFWIRT
ncbi:VOC family protein [Streptomyces sp. NPDC059743]|uniref:VOC family protein n=1 Tax=Streptomyces sp. NPDC059743 TaxID=3346928 RepID=UPI0036645C37